MLHVPQIYYQQPDERSWSVVSTTKAKAFDALLENWRNYVIDVNDIDNRDFILHQWFVCQVREWSNTIKPIERIEWTWSVSMENTIRRELVIRIKRRWDDIVAWQQSIKNLEKILLVCAWDKEKRDFLFWINRKYKNFFSLLQSSQESDEVEKEAEEFYNECIHWLRLNSKSLAVIQSFSWAHEERYTNYPYSCHSWMLIVCIIRMIDFHK